ncbi:hypothetical protein [Paracraurococcus ruber]|uniref:Uncharacterized protein n=1 Tax=Paracraurococcus ruber TaxID=77675 RepID=A0ABS1D5B7_9PROT|nr:hypothetical protein [Paracraurococcus ruber]MBK1661277.1 hypothetical protein [Paracraurococcus ruber]TDG23899.1 hypothetical protein E2C05_26285 [Paracraurococcus ruber]
MPAENDRGAGSITGNHPGKQPEPGPAPVGPAVHAPPQQPVEEPDMPAKAPPGPATHQGER